MAKKERAQEPKKRLVLVRVRGEVHIKKDIADTLEMLHLKRANACSIVDNRPEYLGMVKKVKDYIAWGELDESTLSGLLSKWARKAADKRLSAEDLKKKKFASFEDFAKKFVTFDAELSDLDIKPTFRLHPPTKGFARAGIKVAYTQGGVLGYQGAKINSLIATMAGLKERGQKKKTSKPKSQTKETVKKQ